MALLNVERIKLFSTRSPWWCMLAALVLTLGIAGLFASTASEPITIALAQSGRMFGLVVVMVMAALAVTTEYRFSTIRATFLAVPNRPVALLAKTAVVAALAFVVGEVAGFGSWGVARLVQPSADLSITTEADWRLVAGVGLVYAVGAVIAVSVGVLLRHSAGAISVLLIWALLAENLVLLIPKVGHDIQQWLPFTAAEQFVGGPTPGAPLTPWASLAYVAGIAVALLATALATANKRDA